MPATTTLALADRDFADNADLRRALMAQRSFAISAVPIERWRQSASFGANLASAASSDLGITTGTFGTLPSYITSGDLKAAGSTTRRCRANVPIPLDYEDGQSVRLRLWCSAVTTIADTAMTIDCEAWRLDKDGTLGAADLCATAAQSINSLIVGSKDFDITATTLVAGDQLDVRLSLLVNDAATVTAVIGAIWQVELLVDIR